jgi:RNA polymerase sigma factor (sigma-70 family)
MAEQALHRVMRRVRNLAAVQTYRQLADCELLDRFVEARDEAAFTALIERHGPMVLGVCRRALPSFHDAEDACQATLLVLARKAASVRKKTSLASWLHGVACRVAANLKRDYSRRNDREHRLDAPAPKDPAAEVTWREVQTILDEEMQRLPECYRAPMILCYLECITRDEAAKQLGVSPTTLHGRLERARHLLRSRLARRGLTLGAVLSATALNQGVVQAALAPTFVVSSTKAALLLAAGKPLTESGIATPVLVLTKEALKMMFLTKLKVGAVAVSCAGLVLFLVGGFATSANGMQDTKSRPQLVNPVEAKRTVSGVDQGEVGKPDTRQTQTKKVEKEPGVVRGVLDDVDAQENRITVTLPGATAPGQPRHSRKPSRRRAARKMSKTSPATSTTPAWHIPSRRWPKPVRDPRRWRGCRATAIRSYAPRH